MIDNQGNSTIDEYSHSEDKEGDDGGRECGEDKEVEEDGGGEGSGGSDNGQVADVAE